MVIVRFWRFFKTTTVHLIPFVEESTSYIEEPNDEPELETNFEDSAGSPCIQERIESRRKYKVF